MGISNNLSFSLFFYVLVLVNIVGHVAYAQDSQADYLNAHNAARSEVNVPNLVWDDSVAAFAQNHADQRKGHCNLVHSGRGRRYGENLSNSTGDQSGTRAVKNWVDEKANYDYYSNTCVGGKCGHYTQVVWRKTKSIGCAKVRCNNNGGTFITCNYDPRGNVGGERPY